MEIEPQVMFTRWVCTTVLEVRQSLNLPRQKIMVPLQPRPLVCSFLWFLAQLFKHPLNFFCPVLILGS